MIHLLLCLYTPGVPLFPVRLARRPREARRHFVVLLSAQLYIVSGVLVGLDGKFHGKSPCGYPLLIFAAVGRSRRCISGSDGSMIRAVLGIAQRCLSSVTSAGSLRGGGFPPWVMLVCKVSIFNCRVRSSA